MLRRGKEGHFGWGEKRGEGTVKRVKCQFSLRCNTIFAAAASRHNFVDLVSSALDFSSVHLLCAGEGGKRLGWLLWPWHSPCQEPLGTPAASLHPCPSELMALSWAGTDTPWTRVSESLTGTLVPGLPAQWRMGCHPCLAPGRCQGGRHT